jgi:hypothetical protein
VLHTPSVRSASTAATVTIRFRAFTVYKLSRKRRAAALSMGQRPAWAETLDTSKRGLAGSDPGLPQRACRDLIGRRRETGLVGTGWRQAPGVVTADRATLSDKGSRHLVTNL